MTKKRIEQDIYKFIEANGVLTLATQSPKGPWVCTLYYGVDKDLNMYLVTDPYSIHGKHLEKNRKVAFNIYDSHQKISKPKKGVQGRGLCFQVRGLKENMKGLLLWHKANPGIEEKITIKEIIKKVTDTKVYCIKPTYMKFFNKELYGNKAYGILSLS